MQHTHQKKLSTSSAGSAKRTAPARRVLRHFKPRSLDTYSNELHGCPEQDEEEQIAVHNAVGGNPRQTDENLSKLIGEVNESYLGCLRVTKASVEFGRTAGRRLRQVQQSMGDEAFRRFVDQRLPLSRQEAATLIRFSQEPEVCGADVSPATAMSFPRASQLAGLLHARAGAAS